MKYNYKPYEIVRGISAAEMGLEYTNVQRIELDKNSIVIQSANEELGLVCMEGEVSFECNAQAGKAIFKDMLYIPCHTSIQLASDKKAVLMKYSAVSDLEAEFSHIRFSDVDGDQSRHHCYGKKENNSYRHVWDCMDGNFKASRLLMGICESDAGGWTAWPPHEHAEKREEVYVYFNMGKSFGIQCVYEDMDNPLVVAMVRDGDLVSVPKGYHPSVGCPAGKICYIYCMVSKKAGDRNFMDLNLQTIYGERFE